jgi:uncharacterized protein YdeI (YjbR/CyaY-like superfamily)
LYIDYKRHIRRAAASTRLVESGGRQMYPSLVKPMFFPSPAAFRAWLKKHHRTVDELWVGYYRKDCGKPTISWSESVDEALCFGWIDGVRKKISDEAYTNRFTPRRPGSNWSAINIAKVAALTRQKRMTAAGRAAFAKRSEAKSRIDTYEQKATGKFEKPLERLFKANTKAWIYFESQAPYYRRLMSGWVNGAKQPETRRRRLDKLMAACESGRRLLP